MSKKELDPIELAIRDFIVNKLMENEIAYFASVVLQVQELVPDRELVNLAYQHNQETEDGEENIRRGAVLLARRVMSSLRMYYIIDKDDDDRIFDRLPTRKPTIQKLFDLLEGSTPESPFQLNDIRQRYIVWLAGNYPEICHETYAWSARKNSKCDESKRLASGAKGYFTNTKLRMKKFIGFDKQMIWLIPHRKMFYSTNHKVRKLRKQPHAGVSYHVRHRRWEARLTGELAKKLGRLRLGMFNTKDEAIQAQIQRTQELSSQSSSSISST